MPLTPTYNRTAVQVPTPQVPAVELFIESAGNPGIAPKSSNLAQGDTAAVITKFNKNALRQDLSSIYGGGGFSVLWGLDIYDVSGFTLGVNTGQAMILGLTELASATTVTLPATSSAVYIWLLDNGTVTYQNNSLTAPSSTCVFIGTASTNSTGITTIDYSGIVYSKGNHLWRRTADSQAPTDSPPAGMTLVTQTSGWVYEWDGSQHKQRTPPEQLIFETNGPRMAGGHLQINTLVQSGSSNLTISASTANIIRWIPTATASAYLPATGLILPGMWYKLYNDAASGSGRDIKLYNSTGSTLISTIGPKLMVNINVVVDGVSAFTWPTAITAQGSSDPGAGP